MFGQWCLVAGGAPAGAPAVNQLVLTQTYHCQFPYVI